MNKPPVYISAYTYLGCLQREFRFTNRWTREHAIFSNLISILCTKSDIGEPRTIRADDVYKRNEETANQAETSCQGMERWLLAGKGSGKLTVGGKAKAGGRDEIIRIYYG
ncbi:Hypothetical protein NTJ_01885 [Nesidiocoris tenuis]|uniref:Uncharacterized protein n=1 Tax=Nesidiocoris tenuis TaxID=355587 RepID=A0ABN7AFK5_9HEMI|nr:Hypothetical protein NTJ_01885 [Nesidiocoris tenuis]